MKKTENFLIEVWKVILLLEYKSNFQVLMKIVQK